MATQIDGLIGANGILPLLEQLTRIAQAFPHEKYWQFPTLFWFDASVAAQEGVCYGGIAVACLVTLNVFTRAALIACFVCYLSITTAGQDFTAFQWDVLLLESGFLAIFFTWNSKIIVFLYRLLIARFMFMSGVVKIASGDPTWANLTALNYHYLTQPLPSPLGYYAYFLPEWWHKLCASGVIYIELLVPFFVFMPRPLRLFAAWCFIVLQTSIILTGNYTFFNMLTLLLCLLLFDDRDIVRITPEWLRIRLEQRYQSAALTASVCAAVWAGFVIVILTTHIWMAQTQRVPFKPLATLLQVASAFGVVNNYGPFAVMTTERNEIIVEGSQDGEHWMEYGFKYKPDGMDKPLRWNIPHQPRLDWQMWFAALGEPQPGGWFEKFMRRLKEGSPEVLALLAHNPFAKQPPAYLRAYLYRYTYTQQERRTVSGHIWNRQKLRLYWP
ncbi:lipase maturation factor family protein [Methyloglobulus sp.]|uniref:lipase maturation factor family protein n=1 Tax=Methyloglobulus sp. TaxID=2518622 RepID=UPI0039898806